MWNFLLFIGSFIILGLFVGFVVATKVQKELENKTFLGLLGLFLIAGIVVAGHNFASNVTVVETHQEILQTVWLAYGKDMSSLGGIFYCSSEWKLAYLEKKEDNVFSDDERKTFDDIPLDCFYDIREGTPPRIEWIQRYTMMKYEWWIFEYKYKVGHSYYRVLYISKFDMPEEVLIDLEN